jgi:hypothetical protein
MRLDNITQNIKAQNKELSEQYNEKIIKFVFGDAPKETFWYGTGNYVQQANLDEFTKQACTDDSGRVDDLCVKFMDARKNGYTGDFEKFKKQANSLGLIDTGLKIFGSLFGDKKPSDSNVVTVEAKSVMPYVWGVVGVAVLVGAVLIVKNR